MFGPWCSLITFIEIKCRLESTDRNCKEALHRFGVIQKSLHFWIWEFQHLIFSQKLHAFLRKMIEIIGLSGMQAQMYQKKVNKSWKIQCINIVVNKLWIFPIFVISSPDSKVALFSHATVSAFTRTLFWSNFMKEFEYFFRTRK
jgi:hypothetical protein